MYAAITGTGKNKSVYIMQSFRKDNGKTSSRVYRKLGRLDVLLEHYGGNKDKLMAWASAEAAKDTQAYNERSGNISVSLSQSAYIPKEETLSFNVGYLFLQRLCFELRLDAICHKIKKHHQYTYDLTAILTDLIFARILSPSSKLSSYTFCQTLLEPPMYTLQNLYRALSVLAAESDFIQEELYRNSNSLQPRNHTVLYYDCTNYYFEIEEPDGSRQYGKSKEHRPNPIITMGLFMDADGIPLVFDMYPGNQNEQTTLKPLETKIIQQFGCNRFIYCSDAGLGSKANRQFNSLGNRQYVITHSLKKMKQEDRDVALNPLYFRIPGSRAFIDISTIDESDSRMFHTLFYKEIPIGEQETLIVTYSPKYKAYQRAIRQAQIQRAQKIIDSPGKKRRGRNPNDPARFIEKTAICDTGEIAHHYSYCLDEKRIAQEAQYDGFYAVITNIEGNPEEVVKINQRRWEIEESFRIMKSEFEARPVYVRREDRIKAHFLTCYISLLIYRLLEKKLGNHYTCPEILRTLSQMRVTKLSALHGYVPAYTRTQLTDELHTQFGFRTDYEIMTRATLRHTIKMSKTVRTE
ncbi:IS1634 family transposase [uncultured Megasphaera sp.]|uniref:IS1634 family transposase n=1 Tax=uncultured Megasphaera sp. TaxID=165188 RepID=UPI0026599301|nr:IS1634 family transposase [uncultured Megasphaera sp.]